MYFQITFHFLFFDKKVQTYLSSLSSKKTTGLDGIQARFIVDSAYVIAHPLAHVMNLSLIQVIVSDKLKAAKVVPLFKKSDKTKVENYRPVFILAVLSKIFERVVYDQVESYLKEHSLLYHFQSGFRTGFSQTPVSFIYLILLDFKWTVATLLA